MRPIPFASSLTAIGGAHITGGDLRGLMYGLLEAAEQIRAYRTLYENQRQSGGFAARGSNRVERGAGAGVGGILELVFPHAGAESLQPGARGVSRASRRRTGFRNFCRIRPRIMGSISRWEWRRRYQRGGTGARADRLSVDPRRGARRRQRTGGGVFGAAGGGPPGHAGSGRRDGRAGSAAGGARERRSGIASGGGVASEFRSGAADRCGECGGASGVLRSDGAAELRSEEQAGVSGGAGDWVVDRGGAAVEFGRVGLCGVGSGGGAQSRSISRPRNSRRRRLRSGWTPRPRNWSTAADADLRLLAGLAREQAAQQRSAGDLPVLARGTRPAPSAWTHIRRRRLLRNSR